MKSIQMWGLRRQIVVYVVVVAVVVVKEGSKPGFVYALGIFVLTVPKFLA